MGFFIALKGFEFYVRIFFTRSNKISGGFSLIHPPKVFRKEVVSEDGCQPPIEKMHIVCRILDCESGGDLNLLDAKRERVYYLINSVNTITE